MTVTFNHRASENPITIDNVSKIEIKKDGYGNDRYYTFSISETNVKMYDINYVYDIKVTYWLTSKASQGSEPKISPIP